MYKSFEKQKKSTFGIQKFLRRSLLIAFLNAGVFFMAPIPDFDAFSTTFFVSWPEINVTYIYIIM